jgi:Fe-S-cluster-containing dehydrogenase component
MMLPESPVSDCDSESSFTRTALVQACVPRCATNDKPFQDISNKKSSTAREVVSIIKQGRLEDLVHLLDSQPNTDLNTYVNGNTALHHCLLLGRFYF